MKVLKCIGIFLVTALLLTSCYEDYIYDYEYTSTYFATQQPLRTIIADGDMTFQVGVTLAGIRVDDGSHQVFFEVDTSLLNVISEASDLELLPESYYTLSNDSEFDIQPSSHLRVVNVTLNQEAFTADPAALENTYALPLRITSATVDSVFNSDLETPTIDSRDITIVVVKYISQYSGYYYTRGVQYEVDDNGDYIDTVTFYESDLSQNDAIYFTTLGENTVETETVGKNISSGGFIFTMEDDGSVSVASDSVSIVSSVISYDSLSYSGWDELKATYSLDATVEYSDLKYKVEYDLILRQDPEDDLQFEEW
jgi:hypothetical protein